MNRVVNASGCVIAVDVFYFGCVLFRSRCWQLYHCWGRGGSQKLAMAVVLLLRMCFRSLLWQLCHGWRYISASGDSCVIAEDMFQELLVMVVLILGMCFS